MGTGFILSLRRYPIASDCSGTNQGRVAGPSSEFLRLYQLVIDILVRRDVLTPYQGPSDLHQSRAIGLHFAGHRRHNGRPQGLHFVQHLGNAIVSNNCDVLFPLELFRCARRSEGSYVVSWQSECFSHPGALARTQ